MNYESRVRLNLGDGRESKLKSQAQTVNRDISYIQ